MPSKPRDFPADFTGVGLLARREEFWHGNFWMINEELFLKHFLKCAEELIDLIKKP